MAAQLLLVRFAELTPPGPEPLNFISLALAGEPRARNVQTHRTNPFEKDQGEGAPMEGFVFAAALAASALVKMSILGCIFPFCGQGETGTKKA